LDKGALKIKLPQKPEAKKKEIEVRAFKACF